MGALTRILETMREFYEDPENERSYQEWRKKKQDAPRATNDRRVPQFAVAKRHGQVTTTSCSR